MVCAHNDKNIYIYMLVCLFFSFVLYEEGGGRSSVMLFCSFLFDGAEKISVWRAVLWGGGGCGFVLKTIPQFSVDILQGGGARRRYREGQQKCIYWQVCGGWREVLGVGGM